MGDWVEARSQPVQHRVMESWVQPPVEPHADVPPFDRLPAEWFERVCCDLASAVEGIPVRLYGRPGQRQDGIDFFGRVADGSIVAFQAKRSSNFRGPHLKRAIATFFDGSLPFPVARFVIIGTFDDRDRGVLDALESVRSEHPEVDIDVWGVLRLTAELRDRRSIVERAFGSAWANHLCGTRSSGCTSSDPMRSEGVDAIGALQLWLRAARDIIQLHLEASLAARLARWLNVGPSDLLEELEFDRIASPTDKARRLSGDVQLTYDDRVLVLTGPSGSGKTLQGLAWTLRAADELEAWINSVYPDAEPDWTLAPAVPLWFESTDLVQDSQTPLDLAEAVRNAAARAAPILDAVDEAINAGRIFLVIDDLNQLRDFDRRRLVDAVEAYVHKFDNSDDADGASSGPPSQMRVVMTEVPLGRMRFEDKALAWTACVKELSPEASGRVIDTVTSRLGIAESSVRLLRTHPWTKRPLLLQYLCISLLARDAQVPKSRSDLTRVAVEMVVAHDFGVARASDTPFDRVDLVVSACSFAAARLALAGRLSRFGLEDLQLACDGDGARIRAVLGSRLITERMGAPGRVYSFLVPDFAGYLAARGFHAGAVGIPQYVASLRDEVVSQYSREVLAHYLWRDPASTELVCELLSAKSRGLLLEVVLATALGTPEATEWDSAQATLNTHLVALAATGPELFGGATSEQTLVFDDVARVAARVDAADSARRCADIARSLELTKLGESVSAESLARLSRMLRESTLLNVISAVIESHPRSEAELNFVKRRLEQEDAVDGSTRDLLKGHLKRTASRFERLELGRLLDRVEVERLETAAGLPVLQGIGCDSDTIVAALAYEALNRSLTDRADVARLGWSIDHIIADVERLELLPRTPREGLDVVRLAALAHAYDFRALLVAIGRAPSRLRSHSDLGDESRQDHARKTLHVLAPLARRLCLALEASELEDAAFAVLYPREFGELTEMLDKRWPDLDVYLEACVDEVRSMFEERQIQGRILLRGRNRWSVFSKMVIEGHEIDEIFDVAALRICTPRVEYCYAALATIHGMWKPVQGRIKDYIAMPKFNLYQALHTNVVALQGRLVEIHILSDEMHRRAQTGSAAEWMRKLPGREGAIMGSSRLSGV